MADAQIANPIRAGVRIGLGLVQGLALWAITWRSRPDYADLHKDTGHLSWLAHHPPLFTALLLLAGLVPVVVLGGLGQLRRLTLLVWTATAAALVFGIGWWMGWKSAEADVLAGPLPLLAAPIVAALFIAHHLIAAADEGGGWMAPYPRYFELAWKHGVQLALSAAFAGAFWILLFLGAQLFHILGVDAFRDVITEAWFAWPATTTVFAAAVELTDVRAGLVRGIRTVALTLLAWLTPLMAAITAGFVVTMLFTGLKPLFATRNAAEIVLTAAAALIVLSNAAYQDGDPNEAKPFVLRWGVRLAGVLLVPLIAIAAYALYLRVSQHGLSPERVLAIACVVVGAAYAVGYAVSAVRPGRWMAGLERTNVLTGYLALAILILVLTPVLDPQRVSVDDQIARLNRGKVAADRFDYDFLRFKTGRLGVDALKRLAASPLGPHADQIAQRAKAALEKKEPYEQPRLQASAISVYPAGRTLPPEILSEAMPGGETCAGKDDCVALFADFDGDGVEDILVIGQRFGQVFALRSGKWQASGLLTTVCPGDAKTIAADQFKLAPSSFKDIEVGGSHIRVANWWGDRSCPTDAKAASGASVTVPVDAIE